MDRIPYEAAHLSHSAKDVRNMKTNEDLYNKFTSLNQHSIVERIKAVRVGKKSTPSLI